MNNKSYAVKNTFESVAITGGKPLKGVVSAQGSKNATLPILSTLILLEDSTLYNVPDISDVYNMIDILEYLGIKCEFKNGVLRTSNKDFENKPIKSEFTEKMRASSLFMGPLLSIDSKVRIGVPGGCVIGSRPLDIHLEGFENLGSDIEIDNGHFVIDKHSFESEYTLPFASVGATQNLISYSLFNDKKITLRNVAIEPEIIDYIDFLNKAGAKIKVLSDKTIEITGVEKLKPVEYSIQPDRIEVYTLIVSALATKGEVKVVDCVPEHLSLPLQMLALMGAEIKTGRDYIFAKYVKPLKGVKIETNVYPGFPTDCQQQTSILMTTATSPSIIKENLFNNRFRHLEEIVKMNADVEFKSDLALINPATLTSSTISGYDLRGAASMIIAGLSTEGTSIVKNMEYLNRGYEKFIEKLEFLGAEVTKIFEYQELNDEEQNEWKIFNLII